MKSSLRKVCWGAHTYGNYDDENPTHFYKKSSIHVKYFVVNKSKISVQKLQQMLGYLMGLKQHCQHAV